MSEIKTKPTYENFKQVAEYAKREGKVLCLDFSGLFLVCAPEDAGGYTDTQYCAYSIDIAKYDIEITQEAFEAICVLGGF